jgi:uncharacterized iron-regulated membrane protein
VAYKSAGGEKSLVYADPVSYKSSDHDGPQVSAPLDRIWVKMQAEYPKAKSIEIHPPESDSSSIAANANLDAGTYYQTDYRYFNPYTLEEISVSHLYGRLGEAKFADKMMRMNYDIHVGAIGGLPGKLLAFCVSLVVASLPVTGFYIWYGRPHQPVARRSRRPDKRRLRRC